MSGQIHFLDVPCTDCGAEIGKPCKRSLYPHGARRRERDRQRAGNGPRYDTGLDDADGAL